MIKQFSWQSVFWINVPIGLLGMLGAFVLLPQDDKQTSKQKFDYAGSAFFFVAMISLLLYISNGQDWGFFSNIGIILFIITFVSIVAFIYWELKVDIPLINLSLFRIPVFAVGNIVGFLSFVLIMFPSILLPLYLHEVLGIDIQHIGFMMASQAVAMMIVAPVSGWLTDRIGHDWPGIFGMALSSLSFLLMGQFGQDTSPLMVIIAISLFGMGMGLFQSPNNVSVLESVPVNQAGITGGIIATVRNFGKVSGVAIAVLLFSFYLRNTDSISGYAHSISTVFYIGSFLSLVGLLLLFGRLKMTSRQHQESVK